MHDPAERNRSESDEGAIKEDSFGKILNLTSEGSPAEAQRIRIKLETDTNPPGASKFESKILDFPYPTSVTAQDLPTLFASKFQPYLSVIKLK